MNKGILSFIFFSIVLITACLRDPGFSNTPSISFNSIRFIKGDSSISTGAANDAIRLNLYFQDGNGDLGLNSSDSMGVFAANPDTNGIPTNLNYYNIFIQFLFRNSDGTYKPCNETPDCILNEDLLKLYNGRFPDLNPDRKERPISGTLTYDLKSTQFRNLFRNKSVKLNVYIQDRSLSKSNIILTDSLLIK